jgi:GNAT superfamily N-acetyltransferase
VELRRLGPDDWQLWRDVRLEALAQAPAAFGSALADWQGDGDTETRWRSRLEDVPFNVVALLDGRPAGQVSGLDRDEGQTVELISMWVAPFARGTGLGAELVESVVAWAYDLGATTVLLAVKPTNAPALALYERMGFIDRGASVDDPAERLMTRPVSTT